MTTDIYLFYQHTPFAKLVYITDDFERGLAQCQQYRGMTKEEADRFRELIKDDYQTITFHQWSLSVNRLNTFVD